jgi:hypothetical protein
MGMWGDEGLADFYYLSPRELFYAKVGRNSKPDLEPVVRVVMYTGLLLEFMDKCGELVPQLEASRPEVVNA